MYLATIVQYYVTSRHHNKTKHFDVVQYSSNKYLEICIRNMCWPDRIANKELWKKTDQARSSRKKELEYTLRNDNSIAKQALQWTPQGHRVRWWTRNIWIKIWQKKCGQWGSGTARGRWKHQYETELDGGVWPCSTRSDKA